MKKRLYRKPQLEVSRVNYDVAKANYDTSRKAFDNTFIYAPYDGTVSKKYAENFQQIAPSVPIVNFQSLKMVDISIDIPEKLLTFAPEKSTCRIYCTNSAATETLCILWK